MSDQLPYFKLNKMINLQSVVTDIKQIDPVWAFSYYCKVPMSEFNGSTIKIKSILKETEEKTPSFCIYFKEGTTKEERVPRFNDFSTSNGGDFIALVEKKFKLNYSESCNKIMKDYTKWVIAGNKFESSRTACRGKYKVTGHKNRLWTVRDKDFFLPYHIGSTLLKWGNVRPIAEFTMSNDGNEFTKSGELLYGYYKASGELYKIYQPNSETKFISIDNDYLVGSEHKEGNKFFGILSSWKDALSFRSMDLKIDLKVPPSENVYLKAEYIKKLKKEYKGGFTLLDNDESGIKAMKHYKETYDLNYVYLPLSKDVSDSMRDHGKRKVFNTVVPKINQAIN